MNSIRSKDQEDNWVLYQGQIAEINGKWYAIAKIIDMPPVFNSLYREYEFRILKLSDASNERPATIRIRLHPKPDYSK